MVLNKWKILMVGLFLPAAMALVQAPVLAQPGAETIPPIPSDNNLSENIEDPIPHESIDGKFKIIFPAGCPRVHERTPNMGPGRTIPFVYVFCDKFNKKGEGYSVEVWLDAVGSDGGNPGMDELQAKMEKALGTAGLEVVKQVPLSFDLPSGKTMQGMDLLTQSSDAVGQVWFRGWVVEDRLYLIRAWRSSGDLLVQPGLKEFFNSFQPG